MYSFVYIWEPATGLRIKRLADHLHKVTSVQYSADGQTLASGSLDLYLFLLIKKI